jgi:MFS family permease
MRSLGLVLRNSGLRRVAVSYALFILTEYAVWIAMLVFAYAHGGATAAGLIAVAQLVPAALLAPFLSALADRRPPVHVLVVGYVGQATGMAVTAVNIVAGGPPLVAYAGAVVAATCVVAIRPAQAPLVPALARSAEELTAANVTLSWLEGGSIVSAGLLTGLVLAVAGVGVVFAICTVLILGALALVLPLHTPPLRAMDAGRPGVAREVVAGVRMLAGSPRPRVLLLLLTAEWIVVGALDVLQVVLALDVLHMGRSFVGYLNTASGLGGVLAGAFALVLVGRRLGRPIMLAAGAMSGGLVAIAVVPRPAVTFALVVVIGGGRTILDVATRTLLQRAVPTETLGRVFGVVEGLTMAGSAVGSLMTPVFVAAGGSTAALLAAAAVLPLAGLLGGRALLRLDAETDVPVVEITLLRSLRLFRDLPVPALEGLAQSLDVVHLPPGSLLIREGDPGDRYYAIASGQLSVVRGGRDLGRRHRGDGVGEIALLRDVPRTATITSVDDATVYALPRAPFLAAVTGHAQTTQLADLVVSERLDDSDPER